MTRSCRLGALPVAIALVTTLCGCGGGSGKATDEAGESGLENAADRSVCAADATAVATPYGGQFPEGWPFPSGTVVYDVEDRDEQGTIVTAISTASFRSILDFLNHEVAGQGFRVESGETEAHDAEAEWAGNGHRGRWAIRESAQCPGQTVIQVLAAESAS